MRQTAPARPPLGLILVIEAATAAGSLALLESFMPPNTSATPGRPDGVASRVLWRQLGACDVPMGSGRQDVLTPAIQALLSDAAVHPSALAAVVCGDGPGSFTSLRIAASTAKGLVWDSATLLYGVPSLLLAAPRGSGATRPNRNATDVFDVPPTPGRYLMAMDALREESYVLPVDVDVDVDVPAADTAGAGESARNGTGTVVRAAGPLTRVATATLSTVAAERTVCEVSATTGAPLAASARWLADWAPFGPVPVDAWEPSYGRLAEAQVKWEASHGRALPTG